MVCEEDDEMRGTEHARRTYAISVTPVVYRESRRAATHDAVTELGRHLSFSSASESVSYVRFFFLNFSITKMLLLSTTATGYVQYGENPTPRSRVYTTPPARRQESETHAETSPKMRDVICTSNPGVTRRSVWCVVCLYKPPTSHSSCTQANKSKTKKNEKKTGGVETESTDTRIG